MSHCYVYEANGENYISFEEDKFLAAMAIADKVGRPALEVENVLLRSRVKGDKVIQHYRSGYDLLINYKKA
jgi:hypothetical protein